MRIYVMNKHWLTLITTFSLGHIFTLTPFCNAFTIKYSFLKRLNQPIIDRNGNSVQFITPLQASVVTGEAITKIEVESSGNVSHENFDYLTHWYPVVWARDLEINQPTKVSIFDVDYVIAKINTKLESKNSNNEEVIAMVDSCPHKSAALSEGRITKNGKSFQCAYHGWTFDSKTGECIEIPQVVENNPSSSISDMNEQSRIERKRSGNDLKSNGVAVPAMISQGMVWLFPGGGLEKALMAPQPPTINELDKQGYRYISKVVRDFPIDWTILLENILDPDHGLFAHQSESFDLYTASNSNPMTIEEFSLNNGKGWSITSQVDATYELLKRNEHEQNISTNIKGKKKVTKSKYDVDDEKKEKILKSTSTFIAPNFIQLSRRDENDQANYLTVFYVCPTGTGKSRFMSSFIGKAPSWLKIPRWFSHINLNNFLDQDTHLLATQQRHVLATESQLTLERDEDSDDSMMSIPVRKKLYNYRSPTEKLGAKVGKWLDATVLRVPNRSRAIRNYGGYESALRKLSLTRRESLDRYTQHTAICNDSLGLLKKCQLLQKCAKVIAFIPILIRLATFGLDSATYKKSFMNSLLFKLNNSLTPISLFSIWGLSLASSYIVAKIQKQFEFKYTEDYRNKDMDKIPSVWMDSL